MDCHEQLQALFQEIKAGFRESDRERDPEAAERKLRDVGSKLTDCKRIIREFEKQAIADGMETKELMKRKADYVSELNKYVAQRKKRTEAAKEKEELLQKKAEAEEAKAAAKTPRGGDKGEGSKGGSKSGGKVVGGGKGILDTMSNQQMMTHGRKLTNEIDQGLNRGLQLVNETIQVGQDTSKALQEQGLVLEKINNDLDEMQFSIKAAAKHLKEMTRQMATDKCILGFLLLIVCGIVAVIIMKVLKVKIVKDINITIPLPQRSPPPPRPPLPPGPLAARRLLTRGEPLSWGAGSGLDLGAIWRLLLSADDLY